MSRLLQLRGLQPYWLALTAHQLAPHACVSTQTRCHYEVLGVPPSASLEEIKNAFLHLSKEIHPDTNPDDPSNHERFVRLNQAYSVLREPASRKVYDMERLYGYGPTQGPIARSTHYAYPRRPQQQQFRDESFYESFWENRDRSKDRHVPEDEYYGVKGYKRVSNSTILVGCLAFIVIGSFLQYVYFSIASDKMRKKLDERDRSNRQILREVEETARRNGRELQVELFRQRLVSRGLLDENYTHKPPSKPS